MIVSYLPYMVHDYFPELNNQEIGKRLAKHITSYAIVVDIAESSVMGCLYHELCFNPSPNMTVVSRGASHLPGELVIYPKYDIALIYK